MRDAARADRRAEDRITAGERVGERPQGFASRLRRARRAVLQEAAALAPAFRRRVVLLLPPRHRRDRRGALLLNHRVSLRAIDDSDAGTHHASGKTSGRVADHCASFTAVGPQPSIA